MRDQKGEYELWLHWYQEKFFQTAFAKWMQLEETRQFITHHKKHYSLDLCMNCGSALQNIMTIVNCLEEATLWIVVSFLKFLCIDL